ncbi:MAG: twin-arginine translocation signal domain-containing protein [Actinobacteria bacterium]|nr:MAG: twin-arginine translocation signal domain-containing protein [Actinomycetota bacterium]
MDDERRDRHPLPVSRRRFLERSAMAVAGGALFSCTGGKIIPHVSDTTAAIQTRWPIKRVVYVMLENRSFDNLFGRFPGVEGTTIGLSKGAEVPMKRCPDWLPGDLPHDRAAALNCWNGGKQDGFANGAYGDPWAYTQFDGTEVPNYWHWAREYAISDHFFASANGPSYPNHFFFIAGTSGGAIDNPENIKTSPLDGGRQFKSWGCDAVGDAVFVFTLDEHGQLAKHGSCFDFRTVGEQLTHQGVDWTFYSAAAGIQRSRPGLPHRPLARAHARRRDGDRRCAGREPSGRHVDHATIRVVRSSAGELRLHPQLDQRPDRGDHEERRVGSDRDLPHLGRMGRVLRPHPPDRRRSGRVRLPRAAAHDQPVRGPRDDRRRDG